jgi:hypothetical protein
MSALPPKADINHSGGNVRVVSKADITVGSQKPSKEDITTAMLEPGGLE